MSNYQISINRHAIAQVLATAIALLLIASLLGQLSRFQFGHDSVYGLVQLFNVDGERNIPTFFTVLLAAIGAMLLVVIGVASKQHEKNDSRYWFVLAAGFLFLGYDEAFQVHEQLIVPMRKLMGNANLGFFYFGWVVPGIAGVCALVLFFFKFLFRLPATTRNWLVFAGCLYLGGALVMEMIDGKYALAYGQNLMYSVLTTIEEGLEMSGLATLIFSLLGHIAEAGAKVEFRIDAQVQPALVAQPGFN
jgi:drug/metabolite transporter (DMT)-like permease